MEKNNFQSMPINKAIRELNSEKAAILKGAFVESLEKKASMEDGVAFNGTTGSVQNPYPSPFLTLSDIQIPRTTTEIFKWCKYFYTFDPLISGAVNALANFPITEVYLEEKINSGEETYEKSETLLTYERVLYEKINIYNLLIGVGIDYYLYGNCFVFGEFEMNKRTKKPEWKNLIRLDPSKIIIDFNPATQRKSFKWMLPARIVDICQKKQPREEYEKIPDSIKDAVIKRKAIELNPNNIYHFARPTDSMGDNSVWGTPVVVNVLKLLMYRNTLRQAQEAIAREHIVPMRVYYLNKTNEFNPEADWNNVAASFANELQKSVRDPNYKVVSPVPVQMLSVGGEGRNLLLTPEIEQIQNEILAGMNVPREFIFGGVSYSSSSISLKILENQFITFRLLLKDFVQNFCVKKMAQARGEWKDDDDNDKILTVKMSDLKMQDDVQQKQLMIDLNNGAKISNDYMYKTLGIDTEKNRAQLEKEAADKIQSDTEFQLLRMDADLKIQKKQIENNVILQKYQMELQKKFGIMGEEIPQQEMSAGQDASQQEAPQEQTVQQEAPQEQAAQAPQEQKNLGGLPVNLQDPKVIQKLQVTARQLEDLPKDQREDAIAQMPDQMQQIMRYFMQENKAQEDRDETMSTDMRPMPESRPPRRNSLKS